MNRRVTCSNGKTPQMTPVQGAHRLHSSMLRLDRLWRLQMTTDRLRPCLSVPCR